MIAAIPPLGEIAGGDGPAIEMKREDLFDFGEVVEPIEDGIGGLAVVEALVDFLADGVRETSDFSGAHKQFGS